MEIIPLHWDSKFFGLRIAKAIVTTPEDVFALSGQEGSLRTHHDLIYIFSETGLEMPFETARLVDKKAVFIMRAPKRFKSNPAIKIWEPGIATNTLVSLALISGKYSRFKIDTGFPAGSYERLYTHWIEQSINRSIATEVFCYMIDDEPRGLLTLDRRDDRNSIGLVAVDKDYQHYGIGTAMIEHAVSFVQKHQGNHISVTTQLENVPACRLYSKCGFTIESVTNIWHWWL